MQEKDRVWIPILKNPIFYKNSLLHYTNPKCISCDRCNKPYITCCFSCESMPNADICLPCFEELRNIETWCLDVGIDIYKYHLPPVVEEPKKTRGQMYGMFTVLKEKLSEIIKKFSIHITTRKNNGNLIEVWGYMTRENYQLLKQSNTVSSLMFEDTTKNPLTTA